MPHGQPIEMLGGDHPQRWLKLFGYLPGVPVETVDNMATDLAAAAGEMQLLYGEVAGRPDQVVGPKTRHAMNLERCLFPDRLDPDLVDADPWRVARHLLAGAIVDQASEREAIETARLICSQYDQLAAQAHGGGARWPDPCRKHLLLHIDTRNAPGWMDVDAIFNWSQARWREVGVGLVRTHDLSRAHIRQSFRRGRGWIGLAEFPNSSCSNSVFNYRDPGYNGGDDRNKNLDLHEIGHNMGLNHFRGIMAPTINSSPNFWVRFDAAGNVIYEDPSYRRIKGKYPGPPLTDPTTTTTTLPPPPPTTTTTTPPPPPPPPEDDMGDLFRAILQAAIELLVDAIGSGEFCDNAERMKQAGPLQRLRLQRKVRDKLGLSRREWRRQRHEISAEIDNAVENLNDDDARYLVEEAESRRAESQE